MAGRPGSTASVPRREPLSARIAWVALVTTAAAVPLITSITRGALGGTQALTADAFQVPKAMALCVLLAVATGAWTVDLVAHRKPFRSGPAYLPLAAFAGTIVLSTLLSPQPLSALFGASNLMTGAVTWLLCIWFVVLLGQYLTSGSKLTTLAWAVSGGYSAIAAIALLQSVGADPLGMGYAEADMWWLLQGMSTPGNPNATGLVLVLPLSLLTSLALSERTPSRRAIAAVLGSLVGAALFITLARAAWIGAFLSLATIVALVMIQKGRQEWRILAAVAVTLALVVSVGVLIAGTDEVGRRFSSISGGLDEFSSGRTELWANTARVIARNPLLGTGPDRLGVEGYRVQRDVYVLEGQRYVPQDPHNVILFVAALFGVPALLAFVTFVVMTGLAVARTLDVGGGRRVVMIYAGWVAGIVGITAASLLSVWTITSVFVFFLATGATLAPTLAATEHRTRAIAVTSLACLVLVTGLYGTSRSAIASYHVAQAYVADGRSHLEESIRLAPWDGGLRVNYLWAKIGASGPALTQDDVETARKAADALDADIKLAIQDFPDELLLYRMRADLYSSLEGYPAYEPARLRQVLAEALDEFPGDPEFEKWLAEVEAAPTH